MCFFDNSIHWQLPFFNDRSFPIKGKIDSIRALRVITKTLLKPQRILVLEFQHQVHNSGMKVVAVFKRNKT